MESELKELNDLGVNCTLSNPTKMKDMRDSSFQNYIPFNIYYFVGAFFSGITLGAMLFVFSSKWNLELLIIFSVLGLFGGIIWGNIVRNDPIIEQSTKPLYDSNDIPDWNTRDFIKRKNKIKKINLAFNNEINQIKNQSRRDKIISIKVDYFNQNRIYSKKDLKNYLDCWVVLKHKPTKKYIVYCENVFENAGNWGVLNSKDNLLGTEKNWFNSLNEAAEQLAL